MDREKLAEAVEQPVGVDEYAGLASMDADSLWRLFAAARRLLEAPEWLWEALEGKTGGTCLDCGEPLVRHPMPERAYRSAPWMCEAARVPRLLADPEETG